MAGTQLGNGLLAGAEQSRPLASLQQLCAWALQVARDPSIHVPAFALSVLANLPALLADTKLTDDIPVAIGVIRLEIIEQAAALAHEH